MDNEVVKNKNCSNNNSVNMQLQRPSLNQENFKKPVTKSNSSLCRDRNCQSTRCFKKTTEYLYTKVQRDQGVEMTRTVNHPNL